MVLGRWHLTKIGVLANFVGKTIKCGEAFTLSKLLLLMAEQKSDVTGVAFIANPVTLVGSAVL